MSAALSNLLGVQELGICIDSGLGWLSGPDMSDRARLFQQNHKVFGSREPEVKEEYKKSLDNWNKAVDRTSGVKSADLSAGRPLIFAGINLSSGNESRNPVTINLRNLSQGHLLTPYCHAPLMPNKLTVPQKEWLLEIEWAQRAFLCSYCMALTDNSHTFRNVRTLNIAKISSNRLSDLQRKDIWEALPELDTLTIIVAADFRTVHKCNSGEIKTTDIQPSEAVPPFFTLLKNLVADIEGIRTIKIGYTGGGEHQTGIFGRNRFVLPAPLADYTDDGAFAQDHSGVLTFPNVEDLTLTNCWIAPTTLKKLVHTMRNAELRSLTLESVSLTAHSTAEDLHVPEISRCNQWGKARCNDPCIPDSFFSERPLGSDPVQDSDMASWIHSAARIGSWPEVIDAISPGPTLDLIRYAFQYIDQAPQMNKEGNLEVIDFKSCGYVRLVNQSDSILDQSALPDVCKELPRCLYNRALDLMPVMMHRIDDQLLGQISPCFVEVEQSALMTGFPMTFGWGDDHRKYDNLEDGQSEGGSGRFSGRVERFAQ